MKLSLIKSGMGVVILGVGLVFSHATFATTSVTTLPVQPSQFQTITGTASGVETTTQMPQNLTCGVSGEAKVSTPPIVAVKHQLYNIVQFNTTTSSHWVTPAPVTHTVHSFSERTSMATRTVTQISVSRPPATTRVELVPHTQSVPVYRTLTSYVPVYRYETKTTYMPVYRYETRTTYVPVYRTETTKVPIYDHRVIDKETRVYLGKHREIVGWTITDQCRFGIPFGRGCMFGGHVTRVPEYAMVPQYTERPVPTRISWIAGYREETHTVRDGSRPETSTSRVQVGTRPETSTHRVQTGTRTETRKVQSGTKQIVTYSTHTVVTQPPAIEHISTRIETYPVVTDVPITRVVQEQAPSYEVVSTHTTTQTLASEWVPISTRTVRDGTTTTTEVSGLCPVPTAG